ncbi:MAG: histidinol-phosphate transaminase [Actinomycetota bacterium]|nr:histidinol-phosphate transaminase [Actinomycetota bacterium]
MEPVAVRDDLRGLTGYHSAQVDVAVRLNTNESPYPPPAAWRAELAAALDGVEWQRYPDRRAIGLRRAIAALHGVAWEQVFAANGSNEVLQSLLLAYGGAGRRVVTFEPTYQLHGHIARLTGATVVEGERDSEFGLDAGAAARLIETVQPSVTFLCSPNNPTGRVESPALVRDLLAATPGLLVVDEAYAQFAKWSALELLAEDVALCVVRTFSKTWSMAAARLGYLIGPTWLVARLEQAVLPYHLDAVTQLAGTLALGHVGEMNERVDRLVAERERVTAGLTELDVDVFPSGANFVLFRPRHADAREIWNGLVERGVLVRDCSGWPRLDNCLRVTIGTPAEDDRFLGALAESLEARPIVAQEVGR